MTAQPQMEIDLLDRLYDSYDERHLTDGLPVIPPTPARVESMLATVKRDPQEVLGVVPPKFAPANIQKVAVNAVMAGCRPEYFPVVLTAVEAILDEAFNLYAVQATTNPISPCFVINGPIRNEIRMNCGYNVLGEGNRANATIGRAVRLVMRNIGGGVEGDLDRSTTGWPGKLGVCFGENEERSLYEPFSIDRGFAKGSNVLSVFAINGFVNLEDHHSVGGEEMLAHFSKTLAGGGYSEPILVLCPEHVELLVEDGLTKADVKKYLFENARVKVGGFTAPTAEKWMRLRNGQIVATNSKQPEFNLDTWVPFASSPEAIQVIVAGGAGRHSVMLTQAWGNLLGLSKEIPRA